MKLGDVVGYIEVTPEQMVLGDSDGNLGEEVYVWQTLKEAQENNCGNKIFAVVQIEETT
jgi:hypothetical protein